MKSTFRVLIIVVLVLAVFGQYTIASAATMYKWKGPGADAYFSSDDGCVVTDVSLFTRHETFQNPPNRPSRGSFAYVTIYQYDYCLGWQLRAAEGFAWIPKSDLQVANRLSGATLSTLVTMYDWATDTYFDVWVDLSWTANGPATRQTNSYMTQGPGCKFRSRSQGTFRSAEVNGTITDGFTNYTPWTGWGNIFDSKGTDSFINCD